jgi:hypothetical protein
MLEAILIQAQAAEALSEIEPSSASALATAVLKDIGPMVWTETPLPVSRGDEVRVQARMLESIVRQILACHRMAHEDDRGRALPKDSYKWVVMNAQAYSASAASAANMYMAGARAFRDNGFAEHALSLFENALLAIRIRAPDSVLELIADGAEIIAAIDDGETLRRGMELIETAK